MDAFASSTFKGNPAAIVALGDGPFPSDALMQNIALEQNLAETAFFVRKGGRGSGKFHIRFFTPEVEVDLCGHATLATSHVIFNVLSGVEKGQDSECESGCTRITFECQAGSLTVTRHADNPNLLELNFPSWPPVEGTNSESYPQILAGLGLNKQSSVKPIWIGKARDYVIVLPTPADVLAVTPDFRELDKVTDCVCVLITAAAGGDGSPGSPHFVMRSFCPGCSVPEDPVTGSAHCSLIPFWSSRLDGRLSLLSHQVSKRGGVLHCGLAGERVTIAGSCVLYLWGNI